MKLALRHRLGRFPSDHMPRVCACGALLNDNPYHFHARMFHRRRAVTTRHDMLVNHSESLGRQAGALVLADDHWRPHDWPDLEFFLRGGPGTGHIITDVSVCCPCNPSSRHTARRMLRCAETRADAKRTRYAPLADETGAANLPLVFESFGGMARDTRRLLRRLTASHAVRPGALSPHLFATMARQGLSVCLQRGNAQIARSGLRWAARASSRASSDASTQAARSIYDNLRRRTRRTDIRRRGRPRSAPVQGA